MSGLSPSAMAALESAVRGALGGMRSGATVEEVVEAVRDGIVDHIPETSVKSITAEVMSSRYDRIDPDTFITADVADDAGPKFSVGEMSKFFFLRGSYWVRWLDRKAAEGSGCPKCDGTGRLAVHHKDGSEGSRRCPRCEGAGKVPWPDWGEARRTESGARYYTLSDIEALAHKVAQQGIITPADLRLTLLLVKVQAQMARLIID